jgi:LPXTG-site transpeptidase (sortase) family protein
MSTKSELPTVVTFSGTFTIQRGRRAVRRMALVLSGALLVVPLGACGSESNEPVEDAAKVRGESTRTTTPTPAPPDTPTEQPTTEPEPQPLEGPYTVRIPRIGVDAPVVSIEVNDERVLVPPRELRLVGWWSDGAAPGSARGSAVLVGHSARAGGGVFDDVGDLQAGDTIEVAGASDALTYAVESVEVMSKEDLARNAEEIFDQSGRGRLVVITCEDFDGTTWRSNIVTIAASA